MSQQSCGRKLIMYITQVNMLLTGTESKCLSTKNSHHAFKFDEKITKQLKHFLKTQLAGMTKTI